MKYKKDYEDMCERWNSGELFTYKEFADYYGMSDKEVARSTITYIKKLGYKILPKRKRDEAKELKAIHRANSSLQKNKQYLLDRARIDRGVSRNAFRVSNIVETLNDELVKHLKLQNLSKYTREKKHPKSKNYRGIIHTSDLHLNELIKLINNEYDFTVASKRLQKLVDHSTKIFKSYGVKHILFANTGDILNSDRRLDEITSMASNRTAAMLLSTILLQQVLLQLNKDFDISVAFVSGNESRVKDEFGWGHIAVQDNYDFAIYNQLRYLFEDSKTIEFISNPQSFDELVVPIAGRNFLLKHGMQIKDNMEKNCQSIYGKWSDIGIKIDYILFGHIHAARIGDIASRCSSLSGGNDYSSKGLQYISRASQNIFIVNEKDIHGIRIDLQNTDGYKGYDIAKELEFYDTKSVNTEEKKLITTKSI